MIRRFNGVAVQPQFEEGILNNSVHYKIIFKHLQSNPKKKSFVTQMKMFQSGRIAFFLAVHTTEDWSTFGAKSLFFS